MKCDKILAGTKLLNTLYIISLFCILLSEREVVPLIS